MDNITKSVLTNVFIFVLGIGAGFVIANKVLEDYYSQLAQEEIDSVKETLGNKLKEAKKEQPVETKAEKSTVPLGTEPADEKPDRIAYEHYANQVQGLGYTDTEPAIDEEADDIPKDAAGKTEEDMTDEATLNKYGLHLYDEDNPLADPYVISAEEFADECPQHDKVTLYYYAGDDTLVDEHEEIINDIDGSVGWECFHSLEHEDVVHVRNNRNSIDYEICLIDGDFADQLDFDTDSETKILSPSEQYTKRKKEKNDD